MKLPGDCLANVELPKTTALLQSFGNDASCMADLLQMAALAPTIVDNIKSFMGGDYTVIEALIQDIKSVIAVLVKLLTDCLDSRAY